MFKRFRRASTPSTRDQTPVHRYGGSHRRRRQEDAEPPRTCDIQFHDDRVPLSSPLPGCSTRPQGRGAPAASSRLAGAAATACMTCDLAPRHLRTSSCWTARGDPQRRTDLNQYQRALCERYPLRTLDGGVDRGADALSASPGPTCCLPGGGGALMAPNPRSSPVPTRILRSSPACPPGGAGISSGTAVSNHPEPDQQRALLPLHLPRRPRRARQPHQRCHEDRGGGGDPALAKEPVPPRC